MIVMSVVEFAAKRRGDQDATEKDLYPDVSEALTRYPATNWYGDLLAEVSRLYIDTYHREGGKGRPHDLDKFLRGVRDTLEKTKEPTDTTADRVSTWLATAILNAATQEAASTDEEFLLMEWVTMHDNDVRLAHRSTEGQQRPPGEPFDVDGTKMQYPGDPTVDVGLWINCRCTLAPVLASEAMNQSTGSREGVTMSETSTETTSGPITAPTEAVPWHGVLAPEGEWSGDGRRFAEGALRWRDLPLPLTWQKETSEGHDGSVVVGKIETIERVGNMMNGTGTFLMTPEADEVIGLISEFGKFGISVDADDAEMEFGENDDEGKVTFTSARIASSSVVTIPAFSQAFIALGPAPVTSPPADDVCDENSPNYDPEACAKQQNSEGIAQSDTTQAFVSDKPWSNFTQADYTDEQWYRACVLHKNGQSKAKSDNGLPIREPSGTLNRNGVHAAAARFNQVNAPAEAKAAAKRALRGAYSQLGEEPPDAIKASELMEQFKRGPGWVTNPVATKRIHDYWTKKGQEGYAKIGWGVPGDFNRCRIEVGQEIAENSPDKTRFLNQICAQWHYDALGWWPGRPTAGETMPFEMEKTWGPGVNLVASVGTVAPAAWFKDPHLDRPTALTITDEGQVFGHLALWGTCHTGFDGVCIEPPHSETNYAYFLTGEVITDEGGTAVGQITLGGGHAPTGMRMRPALAHYDATSSAVCDVAAGEDDHGIWVAGWVRPGVTEEQVTALRASPLSGDWRKVSGPNLELIAALAVNVPGFPVPRVGLAAGAQVSLVAAGVLPVEQETGLPYSLDDIGRAVAVHLRKIDARRERLTLLRARVGGEQNGEERDD